MRLYKLGRISLGSKFSGSLEIPELVHTKSLLGFEELPCIVNCAWLCQVRSKNIYIVLGVILSLTFPIFQSVALPRAQSTLFLIINALTSVTKSIYVSESNYSFNIN